MKDTTSRLGHAIALILAGAVVTGLTAACSIDTRSAICMPDEYPVAVIGYAYSGSCVAKDQQPPKDSVRYPKGQVPQHVDDKWDLYWHDHALDANGKLITDPNKIRKS